MTTAEAIRSLFQNIIFLSAITSLVFAQFLKMVFFLIKNKNKKPSEAFEAALWRTGGMPSSHSAVVCSLTTSAGMIEGIASNYFVLCLVFSMLVLRDAMGVRRSAGLQAKALNTLGKFAAEKDGIQFNSVKEIHGHTPFEVLIGAILGIIISVCFFLLFL